MRTLLFDSLLWIRDGPVGVKLNHTLTKTLHRVLGQFIRLFFEAVGAVQLVHFPVVRLVACFGALGATTQVIMN